MPYRIVLGSKSPRRQQLLHDMGISFETRTLDTDESIPEHCPVHEAARYLAEKKAKALLTLIAADEAVITADTVVILNNTILGKPASREEAIAMLKALSGKTHEVVTGVCVHTATLCLSDACTTRVSFHTLTDTEIDFYVDNYQPYDKAGGYGIQEWIGMVAVSAIEGSYFNVIGLPTHLLYQMLGRLGIGLNAATI
jgi:septum formation protein